MTEIARAWRKEAPPRSVKTSVPMTQRERLATTLGILLAGLFEAEEAEAASERRPRVRMESGIYPRADLEAAESYPDLGDP